ncbi:hypothetical protein PSACC_02686 [Paramicrosporidium saccamoebae]|uniref:Uncharacterized protein n=1 Tax=Paramicrosporidium saccamoebae TaxID=1246581 RepID=A0A2H9TIB4_9FUNG|nr:hypothetical protein PSACC_02686 [Paramicrosporidium saccamoebae]
MEKIGPLEVVFTRPVGKPLVTDHYDFFLFVPIYEKQCKLLSMENITGHAGVTDFTYYPYSFTEKTDTTQAQLVITIQPAIGLFHSLSEFLETLMSQQLI